MERLWLVALLGLGACVAVPTRSDVGTVPIPSDYRAKITAWAQTYFVEPASLRSTRISQPIPILMPGTPVPAPVPVVSAAPALSPALGGQPSIAVAAPIAVTAPAPVTAATLGTVWLVCAEIDARVKGGDYMGPRKFAFGFNGVAVSTPSDRSVIPLTGTDCDRFPLEWRPWPELQTVAQGWRPGTRP